MSSMGQLARLLPESDGIAGTMPAALGTLRSRDGRSCPAARQKRRLLLRLHYPLQAL